MGWKEFVASVIGDLAWPAVVLIVLWALYRPIKKLIGRIKNAKGMGAEIEFGMEEVEASTDAALDEAAVPVPAHPTATDSATPAPEPSTDDPGPRHDSSSWIDAGVPAPPWSPTSSGEDTAIDDYSPEEQRNAQRVRSAAAASLMQTLRINRDPSGAILEAWEKLLSTLIDLNVATRGPGRPTRNPIKILEQLKRAGVATHSFLEATEGLLSIRNEVAHGEIEPTVGFSRTYVDRAAQIQKVAERLLPGGSK